MAGKPQLILQSVAFVLTFSPPGLLLFATFLRLRESPASRMRAYLNSERLRQDHKQENPQEDAIKKLEKFMQQLHKNLERARRDGRNVLPAILILEENAHQLCESERSIREIFTGLWVRTMLAVVFAAASTRVSQSLDLLTYPDAGQILVTSIASGCLLLAALMLPIRPLQKAAASIDFSRNSFGDSIIHLFKTGCWQPSQQRHKRLARQGLCDDSGLRHEVEDSLREIRGEVQNLVGRAIRMSSIYEILALAPATAILVMGNLF